VKRIGPRWLKRLAVGAVRVSFARYNGRHAAFAAQALWRSKKKVRCVCYIIPPKYHPATGQSAADSLRFAHAFVYVLEGDIVMQLKDQPAVTLKAGQTFYEGPTDVHLVGRNASNTEPARFVVVLLKGKGAPILTPVKE
jgi:glyoxylate utilization-related uncharacterized protein